MLEKPVKVLHRKRLFKMDRIMYPTLSLPTNDANDTFSIRFDEGLGWVSIFASSFWDAETWRHMKLSKAS